MKRTPLQNFQRNTFDLLVIGGGINGAAIARDASRRGLRVLLVEKSDFASGTTSWSTRLIHGGLRYLEHFEFGLVRESLRERERLLSNARHLVQPLELTIPIYEASSRSKRTLRAGMVLYDLLSLDKSLPHHSSESTESLLAAMPSLIHKDLTGGMRYFDAQAPFPERLVIENLIDAERFGAVVRNYTSVERILRDGRVVMGVTLRDTQSGETIDISIDLIINSTGPWVDDLLRELPDVASAGPLMGGTKGTHLFLEPRPGLPNRAIYVEAFQDGRPFFVLPWNDLVMIGTTDTRFSSDLEDVHASVEDVKYLLAEINHFFPDAEIGKQDVLFTYAGVRPLPAAPADSAADITRRHFLVDHRPLSAGLYSVVGGKLTTHRSLAEDVVDQLTSWLGLSVVSNTAKAPLPGNPPGKVERLAASVVSDYGVNHDVAVRLAGVYGTRSRALLDLTREQPALLALLDAKDNAIAAEVVYAFEQEMALSLADVIMRRMMLTYQSGLGQEAAQAAADVARDYGYWTEQESEKQLASYVNNLERFDVPA